MSNERNERYREAIHLASFYRWKARNKSKPLGNNPINGRSFVNGWNDSPHFKAEIEANKAKAKFWLLHARQIREKS